MSISIGIDCLPGQWRMCRVEQGQPVEFNLFDNASEMLVVARQLCAHYPEPTIVVALDVPAPFVALTSLNNEQIERLAQPCRPTPVFSEIVSVLLTLRALSSHTYCAPSVEYIPAVPLHRFLMRPFLGSAREVCTVIALLHFMREQQASWEEMNFFCVDAGEDGTCVLVVINGQVINGIRTLQGSSYSAAGGYLAGLGDGMGTVEDEQVRRSVLQPALEEAFWEGLKQELAGLLALHHVEDIVILGSQSQRLVERLAETYQVYLFPYAHTEREGYEAALGAALLGEGLEQKGSAAGVVEHLQLLQAGRRLLSPEL